ncbi:hypothetical protein NKH77_18540 [Streptomyces sp. M19]
MPRGHIARSAILANLGIAHLLRHGRGGAPPCWITGSTFWSRRSPPPRRRPDRPIRLAELGHAHLDRFASAGAPADLKRAIALYERAVADLPEGYAKRPAALSDLAAAYAHQYEDSEAPADLARAVRLFEEVLAAVPRNTPDARSSCPTSATPICWVWSTGAAARPRGAGHAGPVRRRGGRGSAAGPGLGRAVGGDARARHGEHAVAARVLDAAVALLPTTTTRDADWSDREHRLGSHLGLVGEAVAAHCAVDDPAGGGDRGAGPGCCSPPSWTPVPT